jgi:hypothetical protein
MIFKYALGMNLLYVYGVYPCDESDKGSLVVMELEETKITNS